MLDVFLGRVQHDLPTAIAKRFAYDERAPWLGEQDRSRHIERGGKIWLSWLARRVVQKVGP